MTFPLPRSSMLTQFPKKLLSVSPEQIHAKVTRTRAEQGLPPTVTDPGALERCAAVFRLMAADEPAPPKPRKRHKPPGIRTNSEATPAA
jgi:hypothetical protein